MSNYAATVVRINNLRPHNNADRLVCTNIFGNNVIVGKETQIGDLGLYFPLESQIGVEFAQANDLIRRKDENGKPAGGMFDDNRRVRAQTFRGEKSMGFWIPIQSLELLAKYLTPGFHMGYHHNTVEILIDQGKGIFRWAGKEGDEIEQLGEYVISQKYVPRHTRTPGTGRKEGRKPRESRILPDQFRFHFDTTQLGRNLHRISPTDDIVITWKLHGTSAIASRAMVKRKLSWLERLLKPLVTVVDTEYDYVYASRRVVKNEFEPSKNHYYGSDIWTTAGRYFFGGKLHTGETVYYELVGYTNDGSPIQKGFDYGCDPLASIPYNAFVYRITQTAVDGSVVELQWNQVKERCNELGVNYVPEIWYGKAEEYFPTIGGDNELWREDFLAMLKRDFVHDQDSVFCKNKVPEEGICVRKEGFNIEVFKLKSFRFLEYETKSLDKGEVDIETQQSEDWEEQQ